MGCRRALGVAFWGRLSPGVLLVALWGCALVPPNSFIDPTKVGRFGIEGHERGIQRVLTVRDTPPGIAGATEPTPEDLVPVYEHYRFVAGDAVGLTIQDLFGTGTPYQAVLEINALGEIRIPELGSLKVAGLTESELEQEVVARLKEAALLPKPVVVAIAQLRRGRLVTILGAVGGAGQYPIPDPNMRLLEVIGMAGDVSPTVRKIYVIRRESGPPAEVPVEPLPEEAPEEGDWVIPPPVDENGPPPGGLMTAAGLARQEPGTGQAETAPTREDLAGIIAPPGAQTQPATRRAAEEIEPTFPQLIFDPETGQVIEAEPQAARPEAPVAPQAPQAEPFEEPFDWEDVEEYALEQRVIAIDVNELKAGNERYNIVVRNRDVVNVPVDTGVFYMMGEVYRPGVYAFGGRDITVKQALAIAGGFTPMAWPQRCEVIRREPGTDKQLTISVNLDAMFYGLEDDFYLRDDDIVNVGTHIVAPFLFVVRNSFRMAYGFGFVYDRNFADRDAISAKANPEDVRRYERQQRGLPF